MPAVPEEIQGTLDTLERAMEGPDTPDTLNLSICSDAPSAGSRVMRRGASTTAESGPPAAPNLEKKVDPEPQTTNHEPRRVAKLRP
ncbi:hypothetical protein ANO11243_075120 [Dothideomycetidae sp. 11243]|nr:hypothetical protein ANO11243_075120 [fungal sp. No.11243]